MNITYQPFLKKLSVIFDIDPQTMNFTKANDLYDTLKVDKYIGKSLPTDLSTADFDNLEHLHNWYTHFTINHNLSKAFTSNKMLKVLSDFDNRIKNPSSTLQWTTLSADEVDIVSAQINLNISSSQCI